MKLIAIDLGSTNIKAAIFDEQINQLALISRPVRYIRENGLVEFDAVEYTRVVMAMIGELGMQAAVNPEEVRQIVLTGQAESLVVLDQGMSPLMNAISWMDERSKLACDQLAKQFPPDEYYRRTGQLAILPTWPATKILWLRQNRPDIYEKAAFYVLLKDYVVYQLTGKLAADCSIATFSSYFDILNKRYWPEMLAACGIRPDQLPALAEPCSDAGPLLPEAAKAMGLTTTTHVNIGTLDHFAGMIGTGNVRQGLLSLSTGTVMALAAIAPIDRGQGARTALHYGFEPDSYIYLPVAESGGSCLEWFRNTFARDLSFAELDRQIQSRKTVSELIFLPYIVGTNAPDFDADACGAFMGLRAHYDAIDLGRAVMEGVAFLLARNIEELKKSGISPERIIATGGGAKSELWCQIKADITGVPVEVPLDQEAACRGAAMIGAVAEGLYTSYADAAERTIRIKKRFEPKPDPGFSRRKRQFDRLYEAMLEITRMP